MIIGYFDLFSGVSGDMLLSAFIDAGLPVNILKKALQKIINKKEFKLEFTETNSHGINGKQLNIKEYPISFRKYSDIINLLENSDLTTKIKNISQKIFHILALAEAKIHNIAVDDVHFHEIGAIDTIVDIVGTATAIDFFNIEKVFISEIPVGTGEIQCVHGILPNPAPATAEILKNLKIKKLNINKELTTPTGASILKGLDAIQVDMPVFKINKIGYGFGKTKLLDRGNFLRILIGEINEKTIEPNSYIYEIEFNVDDMTGEQIGFFIEEIFKFNILDIQCISTISKKNRPAYIFKILSESLDKNLVKFIFQFSTTSGIRYSLKKRIILDRFFEHTKINGNLLKKKIFTNQLLNIKKEKFEFNDISHIIKKEGS